MMDGVLYFMEEIRELFEITEKRQEESAGIEADLNEDNSQDEESIFNEKEIRVSQKSITVSLIEHWIQEGTLNLTPDYQRNLIWDINRKSSLIESLLLNIPIPAFYMDEDGDGIKSVIDGLQRLSAIHQYISSEFQLRNLQYLGQCEHKYFGELDIKYRKRIMESTLVVNILDERCPPMVKLDIFRRVNTGGIRLNSQEVRNIMAESSVRKLLEDMTVCEEFVLATGRKINDIRMGAQELCLRYITILSAYDWEAREFTYYHGLLKMMDACILELNKQDGKNLEEILRYFRKVMNQCHILLGDQSFCKPGNTRINKSLFTGWAVVLFHYNLEDEIVIRDRTFLRQKYDTVLIEDKTFYNSITSSTGSRKYIRYVIETIRKIMEDYYGF